MAIIAILLQRISLKNSVRVYFARQTSIDKARQTCVRVTNISQWQPTVAVQARESPPRSVTVSDRSWGTCPSPLEVQQSEPGGPGTRRSPHPWFSTPCTLTLIRRLYSNQRSNGISTPRVNDTVNSSLPVSIDQLPSVNTAVFSSYLY